MDSPGNPNQPGEPFDMSKFIKPSTNPNPSSNLGYSPFPPSSYPITPSASYPPPTGAYSYPQFQNPSCLQQDHHLTNLQHQRSLSYPTPPLQPPAHPLPLQSPNAGARLMALLSAPPSTVEIPPETVVPVTPIHPSASGSSEFPMAPSVHLLPLVSSVPNVNTPMVSPSAPMRMLSSKLPKGRHLTGDHVIYDIGIRLEGEVQPQLEVTPITKYGSDPGLVLGRQIAVNKSYICYGLKMGAIRVLNINTALRSLLKGLAQRVTDMAFFAEDVHLLASASVDGRVYVWKITEGPDEEDKPQITGKIVIAIQLLGEGESVHPRVSWHCHKQEILVVGIGKRILKIDTIKVGKGKVYSADDPLKCPVGSLIDGVHFVGEHEGVITDLSMCQWMTTRLVSASKDGTIKIWEDRRAQPLAVLRPHDGEPVSSVTFLAAPHRPDHIILITAGPLNREVKIWVSESEEGWLLPSDGESWHCIQTLELKSSSESRVEDVFFNQVVAVSQAGLLLLANAKKNAIYAVHLEYGPNPAATRMDYIAEFTVTMPILSFTGTSDLSPHGEHIVQVYCVQTQAIQQYALDLSQCLPPPVANMALEKSDFSVSCHLTSREGFSTLEPSGSRPSEISLANSSPKPAVHDSGSESSLTVRHQLNSDAPTIRHQVSSDAFTIRHQLSSSSMKGFTSGEIATVSMDSRPTSVPTVTSNSDFSYVASPPLPPSPRLSRKLSGFRSPVNGSEPGHLLDNRGEDQQVIEYSVDKQMGNVHMNLDDDTRNDKNKFVQDDSCSVLNPPIKYKHPTHLVTPSEILMATSSSEPATAIEQKNEAEPKFQDVVVNDDLHNVEVEVKVVDETGFNQENQSDSQEGTRNLDLENKEKIFSSQASDLGIQVAREFRTLSSEMHIVEESRQLDEASLGEESTEPANAEEEVHDSAKDVPGKNASSGMPETVQQPVAPTTKAKRQKGKHARGSGLSSSSPSACNLLDSSTGPGVCSSTPSAEAIVSQVMTVQEMLNQLTTMQKEIQKQMTVMVTVPVTKEGRRLEAALGRSLEKAVKANTDALWAHFQEENAKQEKLVIERTQQMTSLITNCINKDLPAVVEKTAKKELGAVGPSVTRTILPIIEKTTSTAITEAFQRGVGDKAANQLEKSVNSKLEATVARQIQVQFQTSGKQALQDTLKSSLEASVIPAFEVSCRAMFEQVDTTFVKGMVEHVAAAQQQLESTNSPLALALRDAINSASSVTQTLSGELADGQNKLLALAVTGASTQAVNLLVAHLSNGPLCGLQDKIESRPDPTKELSRLISERKYEEAFTVALLRNDVSIVSWLCSKVDLQGILSMIPLPLSQGVLLSLLQQLACDISRDTPKKLAWMTDVAVAINPADPLITMHARPIYEQVYQIVNHHRSLPTTSSSELSSIRVIMHVINSMLMTCK